MHEIEMKNKELLEEVEKLKRQIKILKSKKKYGLVWEEEREPEQIVLDCQVKIPILKEVKSNEIISDVEKPVNVLIEGDNYHALSVLNYTHKKKIDVIYIDPPYNTGAKDWKYNNNYIDINDLYRHSKWLSFMSHRLKLARDLLTPDGVLICTIDHNEQEALGLLLKELFPDKEITCVTIIHNPSGIQGKNFSYNNEYAYFVYRGDKKTIAFEERVDEEADIRQFMNTAKGKSTNYLRESGLNCFYPIYVKNLEIIGFGKVCDESFHPKTPNILREDGVIEVYPIDSERVERKWVFSRQNVESIKDELSVKYNNKTKLISIIRTKKKINYKTVWIGEKFNAKTYGTQLLNNIIGKDFPFPKSLYAVEECIKAAVHNKNKSIILDFFAGSGTTGHAVLDLNKQDNGNRQFILCTNNENNICTEICYPRIEKVIKNYKNQKGEIVEGLGGNLKYFKTELLDIDHISHVSDEQKTKLTYQAGDMIALREGTFEEIEKNDWWQIFRNKTKYTAIYFTEDKSKLNELVERFSKLKEQVALYIFSWGKNEYKNEFTEYKNIKIEDIPEPIIDVYREINRLS